MISFFELFSQTRPLILLSITELRLKALWSYLQIKLLWLLFVEEGSPEWFSKAVRNDETVVFGQYALSLVCGFSLMFYASRFQP